MSIQEYKPVFHDSIDTQYNPRSDQNLDPVARLAQSHKIVAVRRSHNKCPNTSDTLLWWVKNKHQIVTVCKLVRIG